MREDPVPALKTRLASELVGALRNYTQAEAAYVIGTDPPRVNDIRHGRLRRFSIDTLVRYLDRARLRVDVTVVPIPRKIDRTGGMAASVARSVEGGNPDKRGSSSGLP